MSTESKGAFLPTLYLYAHCPFCLRARFIAGLKKIPLNIVYLDHHDETAHIDKVGSKQAPILETKAGEFMKESMPIAEYLDALSGHGEAVIKPIPKDDKSAAISKAIQEFKLPYALTAPRVGLLDPPLPELARREAREYYTKKKEGQINMTFPEALKQTPQLLEQARGALAKLNEVLTNPKGAHGDFLTADDVTIFPALWTTTVVEGLALPENLARYYAYWLERSGLPVLPTYRHARYSVTYAPHPAEGEATKPAATAAPAAGKL